MDEQALLRGTSVDPRNFGGKPIVRGRAWRSSMSWAWSPYPCEQKGGRVLSEVLDASGRDRSYRDFRSFAGLSGAKK